MEVKHFSHDHSLILNEMPRDNAKQFNCYACEQSILGASYDCKPCLFFLHKSCVELPRELTHPCHPEHSLVLRPNPPTNYDGCICDVCRKVCTRFIYHCSDCKFDVDINCALVAHTIQQRVKHPCHKYHQLIPLHKLALFFCDACGTEHKGSSYLCTTCGFWANQQCVSSPTTIKLTNNHHLHPLMLIYSVPYEYCKNAPKCKICDKLIYRRHWIYRCHECQYLVHVNCATSEIENSIVEAKHQDSSIEQSKAGKTHIEDQDNKLPIGLPMLDESVDLITKFIKDIKLEGNYKEKVDIVNNSHKHPLMFFGNQVEYGGFSGSKELLSNVERRKYEQCYGCQQPISIPFYYCTQCNFSLHQWCAELPNELWHPSHPEHRLLLLTDSHSNGMVYRCASCRTFTDGYGFGCTRCRFYLDGKCASLPRSIEHKAHEHPLAFRLIQSKCDASEECVDFGYACDPCKYNLSIGCALLPRTIKHRYDEHPFALIYGASSLGQAANEYYCEICEKKVDSEYWFYHCHDCDQSLHLNCIRLSWWHFDCSYVKVAGHSHYFKLVGEPTLSCPCHFFGKHENKSGDLMAECLVCRFWTHIQCLRERNARGL